MPNKNMQQYYAYVYRDETNVPFYVGKGTKLRAYDHLKLKSDSFFGKKLKKMHNEGMTPEIEIINAINEEHAFFLEECLIQVFGRRDLKTGSLCNLTDGGDGIRNISPESAARRYAKTRGRVVSEETKNNISKALTGKKLKPLTEEHKAKIGQTHKGMKRPDSVGHKVAEAFKKRRELGITVKSGNERKPMSDEHRENIRKARLGKKHSKETRQKIKEVRWPENKDYHAL